ncbi:cupin domain-containing protein [Sphingomonas sp. R86521]|uniref:cupin domain-containing protein n=1 Tax=Sphingomonas sp. R86521 TaxID=3093860 RepID=UPI0036D3B146
MAKFDPSPISFAQGAVRVEGVVAKHKLETKSRVLTSKDPDVAGALKELGVTNVPTGFTKYQLPFVFDRAQFFISDAEAGAELPDHAHDNGDALRIIVAGSVVHDEVELHAGDWMFVPRGVSYKMKIGRAGATMAYCYPCCCAGAADVRDWIVDPAIDIGHR